MLSWYFTGVVALVILGYFVWSAFRLMPRLTNPETFDFESLERAQERYEANQKFRFVAFYVVPLLVGLVLYSQLPDFEPYLPQWQAVGAFAVVTLAFVNGNSLMSILLAIQVSRLAQRNPLFAACRPSLTKLLISAAPLIVTMALIPLVLQAPIGVVVLLGFLPSAVYILTVGVLQQMIFRKQHLLPEDSPLAEMLKEVAAGMGQPVPVVSVFPHIHANAFAFPNGKVMLTEAMRNLCTDRQIVAVLAHEFSHIRDREGNKYQNWSTLVTFSPMLPFLIYLGIGTGKDMPLVQSILICAMPFIFFPLAMLRARATQRMEFKCDADAAELGYGPDLAEALEQMSRYSGLASRWKGHDRWIVTHPDLDERCRRLRATPPVP